MDEHLFLEGSEPPDTGTDPDPMARWIARDVAGHSQCLSCGGEGELREAIAATSILRVVEERLRIEVLHVPQTFGCGGQESGPERLGAEPTRADDTDAGDRDATRFHHCLEVTNSNA
ncbi:unannotated protein [freshwater metagenome]|uniref:Unannotated protein n=1 Tax=freshwater metagenome TaxID=449393 RepID=A0A6J7J8A5_9ZZZZ